VIAGLLYIQYLASLRFDCFVPEVNHPDGTVMLLICPINEESLKGDKAVLFRNDPAVCPPIVACVCWLNVQFLSQVVSFISDLISTLCALLFFAIVISLLTLGR
jgi:hypothetical protein